MIPTISRQELKRKLDAHEKFYLVETLPLHTYEQGHLPGATCLPPEEARELAAHRLPDKNAEIVCYSDNADNMICARVSQELMNLGYKNVRHYAEGKSDWVDAGNALQAGPPEMLPETELRSSAQKAFQQA